MISTQDKSIWYYSEALAFPLPAGLPKWELQLEEPLPQHRLLPVKGVQLTQAALAPFTQLQASSSHFSSTFFRQGSSLDK